MEDPNRLPSWGVWLSIMAMAGSLAMFTGHCARERLEARVQELEARVQEEERVRQKDVGACWEAVNDMERKMGLPITIAPDHGD